MTVIGYARGHQIVCGPETNYVWLYKDTNAPFDNMKERPCTHCHMIARPNGPDPCLGFLDGIKNACCGHGDLNQAYVQFLSGSKETIHGPKAMEELIKLKKGGN